MLFNFPNDSNAIGIDIGGTKIRMGLVRSDGEVLHQFTLPTMAAEKRVMEQVFQGIDKMLSDCKEHHPNMRLDGIGIGCSGQIDYSSGNVHYASNMIPGFTGTPIKELVVKRYGLPAHVDNDVNVLALAEAVFGAGRKARNIICLALGTGVGGAIIMDGVLVHGSTGGAGEVGHLSVDRHGPRCICGNVGCLELYASGTGIANRYREKKEASGLNLTGSEDRSADVVARWKGGEPEAVEVMGEAITALGSAITSLIHVLNPEVIIIGGGVAGLGEPLFVPLREYVTSHAMPSMSDAASIVPAELGEGSNMVGAAIQVWIYNQ
jgi:glucokinase